MLSPRQLRERLDERFRVLTGGSRDVLPRQQTLRALIDWSHDLLDERERTLFRRLAIFVNGLTLEGAVAVGSGEDLDELDVFDVLASLVDKSLVLAEPHGDAVRYRLLESTRAYASEKLDAAGERDLVADRHLRYLRDRFAELRTNASEPHGPTISMRRWKPNWRTCVRRSTVRWCVGRLSTAASCSPRPARVGALSDSTPKAWRDARPILRRSRPTSRGCALGCQPSCRTCSANSGHKVRAFELATEAVEQARAGGDASVLAWALNSMRARRCSSIALTTRTLR